MTRNKDRWGIRMERKQQKKIYLTGTVLLLCILGGTMAYGFWETHRRTENILTMASYKAEITEEYRVPPQVYPGEEIDKVVHVSNRGTTDILVRVAVEKAFGKRGDDGAFYEDTALDAEMIQITFDEELWQAGGDGWFYYKEILKANETTKRPLMKSYTLSEQAGNEYGGKDAQIVIRMESVQADETAAQIWKIREKELGIVWPQAPPGKPTGVVFSGKAQGFEITADGTDLFSAFKNLTPGCARTQLITVANSSQETVEIFLRAAPEESAVRDDREHELIRQLLERYAVIEVRCREKVLYEGPVCGSGEADTMTEDISLGSFASGEQREMTVRLAMAPEMDNRYQRLTGNVVWIFSARGEDGAAVETCVPQTGDDTPLLMWLALLMSGALLMCAAMLLQKKGRAEEEKL